MDAVVVAGGIPQPKEPLYTYSRGDAKALIDVAGRPMIQWVLDALSEAKTIDRVVIIGLSEKSTLTCKKPIFYLSNQGRFLENMKAGTARVLELNPKAKYVLFVSSDIPAITGQMVDWVVNTCMQTKDDLYYNVIQREVMEKRFPTSRRTYTRLKDLEVCGGDMNMVRATIVFENPGFWNKLLDARKNPAAQATLFGLDIVIKYIFRQLSIDDMIQRVASQLGVKGRAIMCPYPEIGMDVDKPHQLEIMRAFLRKHPSPVPSPVRSTVKKRTIQRVKITKRTKPSKKPHAVAKKARKKPGTSKSKPRSKKR